MHKFMSSNYVSVSDNSLIICIILCFQNIAAQLTLLITGVACCFHAVHIDAPLHHKHTQPQTHIRHFQWTYLTFAYHRQVEPPSLPF